MKQIRAAVASRFPALSPVAREEQAQRIEILNTVSACSFCNSTTSRAVGPTAMPELLNETQGDIEDVVAHIASELEGVLARKREDVHWKLSSVREGFQREFQTTIKATGR